jgi:hypothetical protein
LDVPQVFSRGGKVRRGIVAKQTHPARAALRAGHCAKQTHPARAASAFERTARSRPQPQEVLPVCAHQTAALWRGKTEIRNLICASLQQFNEFAFARCRLALTTQQRAGEGERTLSVRPQPSGEVRKDAADSKDRRNSPIRRDRQFERRQKRRGVESSESA